MSVFDQQYARYYDLLYADKDYAAETDYIAGLIRQHCPNAKSILDLGCGTGKHAELLAQRGFRVHGVDQSEAMIARARARVQSGDVSFSVGDVTAFQSADLYDVVVSLFHVVSYQTSNESLKAMFDVASAHLSAGGVFLFDVWYGPAVLAQLPAVRVKRLEDEECTITRIAEPKTDFNRTVVEVNYSIVSTNKRTSAATGFKATHRMRYLFQPELELLLEASGMCLKNATEWMSSQPASKSTWSVCFVARKEGEKAAVK